MNQITFYDKLCLASSIKFTIDKPDYINIKDNVYKFVNSISTILARDKEVVAVYIEQTISKESNLFLGKNGNWNDKDKKYIENILKNLKDISEDGKITRDSEKLINIRNLMIEYCKNKINKRVEKLIKDFNDKNISNNSEYDKLKKIIKNNNNDILNITRECNNLYKNNMVNWNKYPTNKYYKHVKKLGSYAASINTICTCASKSEYKDFFKKGDINYSNTIDNDITIKDWTNVLNFYIKDKKTKNQIIDDCKLDRDINNKIENIYVNKKQNFYCHGELHIIKYLVDKKYKKKCYLGISKLCCYMCFNYINFLNNNGYNFIVSGTHNKLYHRWLLPEVKDNELNNKIKKQMDDILDETIKNEINEYTKIIPDSDSAGNSQNTDDLDLY
jgi:hypothetical protein